MKKDGFPLRKAGRAANDDDVTFRARIMRILVLKACERTVEVDQV